MGFVFFYNGAKLLSSSEPIALNCGLRGSHIACEFGHALVSALPVHMQAKILGFTGVIVSAFCFWLVLVFWKGTRKP
jgi:hypothetical protein